MSAVTGRDGSVTVEAPLGKVEVTVGRVREETWVGVDLETVLEVTC
jgi:hypothetical protein